VPECFDKKRDCYGLKNETKPYPLRIADNIIALKESFVNTDLVTLKVEL